MICHHQDACTFPWPTRPVTAREHMFTMCRTHTRPLRLSCIVFTAPAVDVPFYCREQRRGGDPNLVSLPSSDAPASNNDTGGPVRSGATRNAPDDLSITEPPPAHLTPMILRQDRAPSLVHTQHATCGSG